MRIEVHRDQKHLLLLIQGAGGYDRANDLRRLVTASRFAKKESNRAEDLYAFRYPLSVDKCREMREVWGRDLKVETGLSAWYREAVKLRDEQVRLSQASDTSLPLLAQSHPAFNAWLKGDQRVTAAWMANAYRGGGLLADEVGTGKTVGVIAGLIEANIQGSILVVCPKISVKAVWGKEFQRHCPDIPVYLARSTRPAREKALAQFAKDDSPRKVLVIVAEMLRVKAFRQHGRIEEFLGYEHPPLFSEKWSAVVVDESHKLLGSMDVVKGTLTSEGLKDLNYVDSPLKVAVSATPFGKGGRIQAMFGTLHWLWPDEFPSRWAWLEKYFNVVEEQVYVRGGGGATKPVRKVGGLKDNVTEQQFWDSLGPRILRRRLEDVSPAHRGLKNYIEVLCEMESRQAKQYRTFTDDAEIAVDGGVITTVGVLDYLTRSRQFANGVLRKEGGRVVYTGESAKIDKLLAHLADLEPGRKVVVSSQYNEFLDAAEARLEKEGYGCWRLDGRTSERNRELMMNDFQSDRSRHHVFLLNGQAGGVSITLDAAEELHALDEMYPPEANTQLYGRIFRRGRAHEVMFYLYRSIGTIDVKIGHDVGAGHAEQLRLLDGRLGREYARKLAKYQPEEKQ